MKKDKDQLLDYIEQVHFKMNFVTQKMEDSQYELRLSNLANDKLKSKIEALEKGAILNYFDNHGDQAFALHAAAARSPMSAKCCCILARLGAQFLLPCFLSNWIDIQFATNYPRSRCLPYRDQKTAGLVIWKSYLFI